MSDELLLAIDAGTGSCRAVLFDARRATRSAIGQREYVHAGAAGRAGLAGLRHRRATGRLICDCIREALATRRRRRPARQRGERDRACARAWSSTTRAGDEIWACPNVDSRAGERGRRAGRARAPRRRSTSARGDWVAITAPARFRWIAQHEPDVFAAIAHVGMLGDWILTRLCGRVRDRPVARLELRDVRARRARLVGAGARDLRARPLGLPATVVEPGTVVGAGHRRRPRPRRACARARRSSPAAPTRSSGCSASASPQPGRFTVVGGSFWQQHGRARRAADRPRRRGCGRSATPSPGRWMIEGIGFYCGIVMRWFRDAFCELEKARGGARAASTSTTLLERAAAALPPGSNGVFGDLLEPDAGEPLGARLAGVRRLRRRRPERAGRQRVLPRDRGERRLRRRAATCEIVEEVAGLDGRRGRDDRRRGQGRAVAADRRRRARDAGARPGGQGVDRARRGDLRRRRRRPVRGRRRARPRSWSRFERTFEPEPGAAARLRRSSTTSWLELYRRSLELSEAGLVRPLWRAAGT